MRDEEKMQVQTTSRVAREVPHHHYILLFSLSRQSFPLEIKAGLHPQIREPWTRLVLHIVALIKLTRPMNETCFLNPLLEIPATTCYWNMGPQSVQSATPVSRECMQVCGVLIPPEVD